MRKTLRAIFLGTAMTMTTVLYVVLVPWLVAWLA